jgi:asparagine synthase (glutamine-hydrolysing)
VCGIAGVAGALANIQLLESMLRIMAHRGSDARGHFVSSGICLGHNRLAINDLSENANQPFVSSDQSVVLVVNGEIYNFKELRCELEKRGCKFKSQSDSEVILHGYLEFGEDIIPRLNGMFALALWDTRRRELLIARDRLGIKPLYYAITAKGFHFASELKALAQSPDVSLEPDFQALTEYLVYENCFAGRSLNRAIRLVRPGEMVVFGADTRSRFYWQPTFPTGKVPRGDVYEAYRQLSRRAVDRHLISDVPVGSYLSAGIDSSTVTYWSSRHPLRPPRTFTGSFGMNGYYDESADAARLASELGCANEKVEIRPQDFIDHFEDLCWHLDEPRAGMGAFPQYMVARQASRQVKVILTGHGGDELFAGYPVFRNLLAARHPLAFLRATPLREMVLAGCFALYPLICRQAAYRMPVVFPPRLWQKIIAPDLLLELARCDPAEVLATLRATSRDSTEETTLVYLREYLPSLFKVEDNLSMAFSLESRTPLCDNDLLDFALSLPLETKLSRMELKHVPRQAMRGLLPDFLFKLPKRGFPTPLRLWFKGELRTYVREFIADGAHDCPLFNRRKLLQMVEAIMASSAPYPLDEIEAHRLWVVMSLIAHSRMQRRRYVR